MMGQHISSNAVRLCIAQNIRRRREQLRLTQDELASACGWANAQTLSSIERGEREVKATELVSLAQALHCRMTDFYETDVRPSMDIAWRKKPGNGAETDAAHISLLCQHYDLLEGWIEENHAPELPYLSGIPHRVSQATYEWASAQAEVARGKLGLGNTPDQTLQWVLEESFGVRIFYFPTFQGSAASGRDGGHTSIAINANEPRGRRNFSLAHELFHLMTWNVYSPQTTDSTRTWEKRIEQLADIFASSLLLPVDVLQRHLTSSIDKNVLTWRALAELAQIFDVTCQALVWRLVGLRYLSEEAAYALLENPQFSQYGPPSENISDTPSLFPERYHRLVKKAYQQGNISARRAAELLERTVSDLRHDLAQWEEEEEDDKEITLCFA